MEGVLTLVRYLVKGKIYRERHLQFAGLPLALMY